VRHHQRIELHPVVRKVHRARSRSVFHHGMQADVLGVQGVPYRSEHIVCAELGYLEPLRCPDGGDPPAVPVLDFPAPSRSSTNSRVRRVRSRRAGTLYRRGLRSEPGQLCSLWHRPRLRRSRNIRKHPSRTSPFFPRGLMGSYYSVSSAFVSSGNTAHPSAVVSGGRSNRDNWPRMPPFPGGWLGPESTCARGAFAKA